ncbi:unnamed protein product [Musa acuminata subsp. malaccensis]|uniref:(wild Malaysian banana) hypothetical protein n=1 Tax=Musa acuminata subsp. malaccensis TaxID=214687 RepID=A0A804HY49_MUSAM|nr:unnamed protein product [Musa acuminata subsp. malaccensis]
MSQRFEASAIESDMQRRIKTRTDAWFQPRRAIDEIIKPRHDKLDGRASVFKSIGQSNITIVFICSLYKWPMESTGILPSHSYEPRRSQRYHIRRTLALLFEISAARSCDTTCLQGYRKTKLD